MFFRNDHLSKTYRVPVHPAGFLVALLAAVTILYAVLLAFTALVFWSPGVLFTWVFDGVFQMARYPLGL